MILELTNEKQLKEANKVKSKLRKYIDGIRIYLDTPSEELKYSTFEMLVPYKNVEIITEGKTDAIIIAHAFSVLTNYKEPYWNISSIGKIKKDSGGATELRKQLEDLGKLVNEKDGTRKTVIGIFDNDAKGNQEFGGLSSEFQLVNNRLKKHKEEEIYALKLPIPDDEIFQIYIQEKQEFKFFEIENYFPIEYLQKNNMIKETPIPNLYEIVGNKTDFASLVYQEKDEELFRYFPTLFRTLDEICKADIIYIE